MSRLGPLGAEMEHLETLQSTEMTLHIAGHIRWTSQAITFFRLFFLIHYSACKYNDALKSQDIAEVLPVLAWLVLPLFDDNNLASHPIRVSLPVPL